MTGFLWVYNSVYTYFLKSGRIYTKLITVAGCGERRKKEERRGLGLVEISQRELGSIWHAVFYLFFLFKENIHM